MQLASAYSSLISQIRVLILEVGPFRGDNVIRLLIVVLDSHISKTSTILIVISFYV